MTFDLNIIKFIQLPLHLKVHLIKYEKHDFYLTQTNKTNVTVNYIVLGSQKFSKNVNIRQGVQWNLQIKDTLGMELLSFVQRLSSGGRFNSICYF